jgi:hypothetical protein
MKKRLVAVAALVALLLLAGCGGGDDNGGNNASAPKKFPTSTVQCDASGIDDSQGKTGTCSRDGVTYTVVNKAQPLSLEELDAKVLKVTVTKVLKGQSKLPARQGHTWVVVQMQIKNKLDKPQRVGGPGFEQMMIGDGNVQYLEAPSTVLSDSWFQSGTVLAGATKTGRAVFEITDRFARNFDSDKVNLGIVNFSDSGFTDQSKRVGVIRLWQ